MPDQKGQVGRCHYQRVVQFESLYLRATGHIKGKELKGMKSHLQHHLNRLYVYYGEITVTFSEEQKSIVRLTIAGKKLHFDDVVETVA